MNDNYFGIFLVCSMVLIFFLGVISGRMEYYKPLNLTKISTQVSKCSQNGGVKDIMHDYDIMCENGAKFKVEN